MIRQKKVYKRTWSHPLDPQTVLIEEGGNEGGRDVGREEDREVGNEGGREGGDTMVKGRISMMK